MRAQLRAGVARVATIACVVLVVLAAIWYGFLRGEFVKRRATSLLRQAVSARVEFLVRRERHRDFQLAEEDLPLLYDWVAQSSRVLNPCEWPVWGRIAVRCREGEAVSLVFSSTENAHLQYFDSRGHRAGGVYISGPHRFQELFEKLEEHGRRIGK